MIAGLNLFDFVQFLSMSKASKVLEFEFEGGKGKLYVENGAIVHAESNEQVGEEAACRCLAEEAVVFKEHPWMPVKERSVSHTTTHLLLEAARLKDEKLAGKGPTKLTKPFSLATGHVQGGKERKGDIVVSKVGQINFVDSVILIKSKGELIACYGESVNDLKSLTAIMSDTGKQLQTHLDCNRMDSILIQTMDEKKVLIVNLKSALLCVLILKEGNSDLIKSEIIKIVRHCSEKKAA